MSPFDAGRLREWAPGELDRIRTGTWGRRDTQEGGDQWRG